MAKAAVLASGSGSNFQAIVEALAASPHQIRLLICDQPGAYCLERARALGVPAITIPYPKGTNRAQVEQAISAELQAAQIDLVILAGFMRILTPVFVDRWSGRLVNIHPALLPRHPGAHGIADSFHSGDAQLGVTVHWVDAGVDTGPIIAQQAFDREAELTLAAAEERIHQLEHGLYPQVIRQLLDQIDANPAPQA